MKKFTRLELQNLKGQDGNPVLVAVNGKVYDVSKSSLWNKGVHVNQHESGADLTDAMATAPHGFEVFEKIPQVGILVEEKDEQQKQIPNFLVTLLNKFPILRRHPHPMFVHFPIAFTLLIPIFLILYVVSGNIYFERTAFYLLIASIIFTPFAIVTGLYSWWLNYLLKWNLYIKIKLALSILLFPVLLACFFLRLMYPDIMIVSGNMKILYMVLCICLPGIAGVIGWSGGRLVFPY